MATRKLNAATADEAPPPNEVAAAEGAADAEALADERVPLQEPEGGWPPDEYTGQAGVYVRDPFTGIRKPLVE